MKALSRLIRTGSLIALLPLACAVAAARAEEAPAAKAPAAEAPASASLRRGKLLFIQCRACHELEAGLPHKVGPNLHGVIGRKAGTAEGFAYSEALKSAGFVWDRATLDRWIEKPSAVVPGTAMAFAGVANPQDRAALLEYLESQTR
jgi:cytochrome c